MYKKSIFVIVSLVFVLAGFVWAQNLQESFDAVTFPPEGWRVINNDGGNTFLRATSNYNSAPACAGCLYDNFYLTNDEWLVTPRLQGAVGDTLVFYYRSVDAQLESLEVRLSLKGPKVSDFTRVLWARRINNYSSYHVAKISLYQYVDSTFYIAFRYYVGYPLQPIGVGIYLDDIAGSEIYTSHDAGITQIIAPIGVSMDSIVTPSSKVKNFGSYPETIPVVFKIPGFYEASDTIILLAGSDTIVNFPACTLSSGSYNTVAYTSLTGDDIPSNDTLEGDFIIRTTNIWLALNSFPKIVKSSGSSLCYDSTGFIYGMRSSDTSFYAYSLLTGNWEARKGMSIKPRSGARLVWAGGDEIYALPRYKKTFTKYSVSSNTWSLVESIPVKPKSRNCLYAYQGFIYCLIGDTTFLRYSIAQDTWSRIKGMPVKIKTGSVLSGDTLGYIYALRGSKKDFYRYSISGNTWTIAESIPIRRVKKGASLTTDGYNIYCLASGKTRKFFRYNEDDGWIELDSTPLIVKTGASIAYARARVYCLRGSYSDSFWCYIPGSAATGKRGVITVRPITSSEILSYTNQLSNARTILVFNVSGRIVTRLENNPQTVKSALKNLPSGIYFIGAENENNVYGTRKKIVITK